jgi:hypothetical protein
MEPAMMLDQHHIRAFADHGESWTHFTARTVSRAGRLMAKGALMMIRPLPDRLRRARRNPAPTLVAITFIGIAALPAVLAIGLAA